MLKLRSDRSEQKYPAYAQPLLLKCSEEKGGSGCKLTEAEANNNVFFRLKLNRTHRLFMFLFLQERSLEGRGPARSLEALTMRCGLAGHRFPES